MSSPESSSDEYQTADLAVSAFLVTKGYPLLGVHYNGAKAFFRFPASAEATARLFFQPGRNLVDARLFHYNVRELRGMTKEAARRW
jgi:hypothetical protein